MNLSFGARLTKLTAVFLTVSLSIISAYADPAPWALPQNNQQPVGNMQVGNQGGNQPVQRPEGVVTQENNAAIGQVLDGNRAGATAQNGVDVRQQGGIGQPVTVTGGIAVTINRNQAANLTDGARGALTASRNQMDPNVRTIFFEGANGQGALRANADIVTRMPEGMQLTFNVGVRPANGNNPIAVNQVGNITGAAVRFEGPAPEGERRVNALGAEPQRPDVGAMRANGPLQINLPGNQPVGNVRVQVRDANGAAVGGPINAQIVAVPAAGGRPATTALVIAPADIPAAPAGGNLRFVVTGTAGATANVSLEVRSQTGAAQQAGGPVVVQNAAGGHLGGVDRGNGAVTLPSNVNRPNGTAVTLTFTLQGGRTIAVPATVNAGVAVPNAPIARADITAIGSANLQSVSMTGGGPAVTLNTRHDLNNLTVGGPGAFPPSDAQVRNLAGAGGAVAVQAQGGNRTITVTANQFAASPGATRLAGADRLIANLGPGGRLAGASVQVTVANDSNGQARVTAIRITEVGGHVQNFNVIGGNTLEAALPAQQNQAVGNAVPAPAAGLPQRMRGPMAALQPRVQALNGNQAAAVQVPAQFRAAIMSAAPSAGRGVAVVAGPGGQLTVTGLPARPSDRTPAQRQLANAVNAYNAALSPPAAVTNPPVPPAQGGQRQTPQERRQQVQSSVNNYRVEQLRVAYNALNQIR